MELREVLILAVTAVLFKTAVAQSGSDCEVFSKTSEVPQPSDKCGKNVDPSQVGIGNQAVENKIKDFHKSVRDAVKNGQNITNFSHNFGAVSNLKDLTWNTTVSNQAQAHTNRCENKKLVCSANDPGQSLVDKIIEPRDGAVQAVDKILNEWAQEINDCKTLNVFNITQDDKDHCEPILQILSARVQYYGCGLMRREDEASKKDKMYMVCHYHPNGVEVGKPLFAADSNNKTNSTTAKYNECNPQELISNNPVPSEKCGANVDPNQVNTNKEVLKNTALEYHNKIRKAVVTGEGRSELPENLPRAEELKDLSHDPQLAAEAQAWANRCENKKLMCPEERAQNVLELDIDPSKSTENALKDIYSEMLGQGKRCTSLDVSKLSQEAIDQCGSLTQVIAANTDSLGCGSVRRPNPATSKDKLYVVCFFKPNGNVVGQPLYKISSISPNTSISTNVTLKPGSSTEISIGGNHVIINFNPQQNNNVNTSGGGNGGNGSHFSIEPLTRFFTRVLTYISSALVKIGQLFRPTDKPKNESTTAKPNVYTTYKTPKKYDNYDGRNMYNNYNPNTQKTNDRRNPYDSYNNPNIYNTNNRRNMYNSYNNRNMNNNYGGRNSYNDDDDDDNSYSANKYYPY